MQVELFARELGCRIEGHVLSSVGQAALSPKALACIPEGTILTMLHKRYSGKCGHEKGKIAVWSHTTYLTGSTSSTPNQLWSCLLSAFSMSILRQLEYTSSGGTPVPNTSPARTSNFFLRIFGALLDCPLLKHSQVP